MQWTGPGYDLPNTFRPSDDAPQMPMSIKEQLPRKCRVVGTLEADIDSDRRNEFVIGSGYPHPRLKEYLSSVRLWLVERDSHNSSSYAPVFVMAISDGFESLGLYEIGGVRFCKVKEGKTNQLAVFWTDTYGSGHAAQLDVFDVGPSEGFKRMFPERSK